MFNMRTYILIFIPLQTHIFIHIHIYLQLHRVISLACISIVIGLPRRKRLQSKCPLTSFKVKYELRKLPVLRHPLFKLSFFRLKVHCVILCYTLDIDTIILLQELTMIDLYDRFFI